VSGDRCFMYEFIGSVVLPLYRNGCATSEDMLWKLEALQTFVFDLHWPDEVFGEHISQRLRTLSTEMIEAAANRCAGWPLTLCCFNPSSLRLEAV